MNLYFAGAEQPKYLRQLDELGVTHVAISFYEWQRRHSVDEIYKHVPNHMQVCVTPGVAKKEAIDFKSFAQDYLEFCERNADQALIYDLDAPYCPIDVRVEVRSQLSILPNVVMFPDPDEDPYKLASQFERLGINATRGKATSATELRRLPASLYGSNITDPKTLRIARFVATTSFAWLSGRRYGELWVFARNKLHHYAAENLSKAVRAHRRDIEAYGVSPDALMANDHDALTAIAVKSLQAMAESLSKRPRDRGVSRETGENTVFSADGHDIEVVAPGSAGAVVPVSGIEALPITERERVLLPVVAINDQDGGTKVGSVGVSLRQCESCVLSDVCPKYQAESSCAFKFPVEIKTDAQWEAASQALLEMQFQRIAFARFAEEIEGGTINSKVGQEMDRWHKMLASVKDLKTPTPAPGQGAMSRVFGAAPTEGTPERVALEEGLPHGIEEDDEEILDLEGEEDFESEFREAEDADTRYASAGQEP